MQNPWFVGGESALSAYAPQDNDSIGWSSLFGAADRGAARKAKRGQQHSRLPVWRNGFLRVPRRLTAANSRWNRPSSGQSTPHSHRNMQDQHVRWRGHSATSTRARMPVSHRRRRPQRQVHSAPHAKPFATPYDAPASRYVRVPRSAPPLRGLLAKWVQRCESHPSTPNIDTQNTWKDSEVKRMGPSGEFPRRGIGLDSWDHKHTQQHAPYSSGIDAPSHEHSELPQSIPQHTNAAHAHMHAEQEYMTERERVASNVRVGDAVAASTPIHRPQSRGEPVHSPTFMTATFLPQENDAMPSASPPPGETESEWVVPVEFPDPPRPTGPAQPNGRPRTALPGDRQAHTEDQRGADPTGRQHARPRVVKIPNRRLSGSKVSRREHTRRGVRRSRTHHQHHNAENILPRPRSASHSKSRRVSRPVELTSPGDKLSRRTPATPARMRYISLPRKSSSPQTRPPSAPSRPVPREQSPSVRIHPSLEGMLFGDAAEPQDTLRPSQEEEGVHLSTPAAHLEDSDVEETDRGTPLQEPASMQEPASSPMHALSHALFHPSPVPMRTAQSPNAATTVTTRAPAKTRRRGGKTAEQGAGYPSPEDQGIFGGFVVPSHHHRMTTLQSQDSDFMRGARMGFVGVPAASELSPPAPPQPPMLPSQPANASASRQAARGLIRRRRRKSRGKQTQTSLYAQRSRRPRIPKAARTSGSNKDRMMQLSAELAEIDRQLECTGIV